MNDQNIIANPVSANLSTDELLAELAKRSVKVKVIAEKAKAEKIAAPVLTAEEHLLNAFKKLVKTEIVWVDGTEGVEGHNEVKLAVIPAEARAEGTDEHALFDALSLKARTTEERLVAAKRPKYEGKKRGPKSKAELEAEAKAKENGDTPAPATGDETPAA